MLMGTEPRYRVIFSGEIVEGYAIEEVKEKLAALFKTESARIEQIFKGKALSIKKNIDYTAAQRYCDALQKFGAVCKIMPMAQIKEDVPPRKDQACDLEHPHSWVGPFFADSPSPAGTRKRHSK